MKNILIAASFPPPYFGTAIMVEHLSKIKIDGVNVEKFNLQFNLSYSEIEKFKFKKLFKLFEYLGEFNKIIVRNNIHLLIICNSFRLSALLKDFLFIFFAKRKGLKVLFYSHGKGFYDDFYLKRNFFWKKIIDYIFTRVDYVVTISRKTIPDYYHWVNEKNIFCIYNSIKEISARSVNDSDGKIENFPGREKIKILYLSTVTRSKGMFVLLDAVKLLKDYNDLEFTVCGDYLKKYPKEKKLISGFIAENGLNDKIKMAGRVDGEDKDNVFKTSDLFIFPSLNDSFGLVVIEAISAGLPVIVTPQGALTEFLEDKVNCFFIPENDPEALAEKIKILKDDPALRNKMSINNRNLFKEKFTLDVFYENWTNLFNKIL